MTNIITNLPASFRSKYFRETESANIPEIRREGNITIFPAFVRQETRQGEDGESYTAYRYFEVPVPFTGQDTTDYESFALSSYAAIRKFFYGTQEQQSEMRDDCEWEAHRQSVRTAFPKTPDAVNEAEVRFQTIKAEFWETVDAAAAAVGKRRTDLPEKFNAEEMLAWAAENGMAAEDIAKYTSAFAIISLNLLQNSRNWDELF